MKSRIESRTRIRIANGTGTKTANRTGVDIKHGSGITTKSVIESLTGIDGKIDRPKTSGNSFYVHVDEAVGPKAVEGRRRQLNRWKDDFKKVAGPEWLRIAKDGNKWKALEGAFVQRQAVKRGDRPNAENMI
ncbi:hypothetical protein EVAR_5012_1 [Eumeta japonica]|uniref:Uncharacterized protein n=1 Tax=Eumeta variegata TaxID=151549 RepID=A0A4C1SWM8_EUMVA|nr:hypothetical protein EVAR_5012_1 [Eumeta japonica]